MGEVKHTKGPWEWKDDDREKFGHYRLHPGILATDLSDGTPWGDEIDRANARLIAAAPDLLVALSGLLERYVGLVESGDAGFWDAEKEDCVIKARAAIAKATPSLHEGERG